MPTNWQDDIRRIQQQVDQFWLTEYPQLDASARLAYWEKQLDQALRAAQSAEGNPYAAITVEWHAVVQELEPDIDLLLQQLFAGPWQDRWDKDAFFSKFSFGE
ncbi:MAG: hypothetical protein H6555_00330 [Lewinellaceae bacterium]|nr:hypothetical protein [Lewinellaceae bacterium]